VPSPEFVSLVPAGKSVQLSWLASTGLVYQVQYETNLTQGNWLNLNAAATASGFSGSVLDTNARSTAPSHYYRLKVSP
jgi:hypothetical protein